MWAPYSPDADEAGRSVITDRPSRTRTAVVTDWRSSCKFAYAACGDADLRWAQRINQSATRPRVYALLRVADWLGNGVLWYVVIAALFFSGNDTARACAIDMLITGTVGLLLYMALKRSTSRARPFARCADIQLCARALDEFSFPSGHAQHTVAFALVLGSYYPLAAFALAPFVVLVSISRVALGLHYPSDVVAGAALGAAIAATVLAV